MHSAGASGGLGFGCVADQYFRRISSAGFHCGVKQSSLTPSNCPGSVFQFHQKAPRNHSVSLRKASRSAV